MASFLLSVFTLVSSSAFDRAREGGYFGPEGGDEGKRGKDQEQQDEEFIELVPEDLKVSSDIGKTTFIFSKTKRYQTILLVIFEKRFYNTISFCD